MQNGRLSKNLKRKAEYTLGIAQTFFHQIKCIMVMHQKFMRKGEMN
jgi:hypothetical protein